MASGKKKLAFYLLKKFIQVLVTNENFSNEGVKNLLTEYTVFWIKEL